MTPERIALARKLLAARSPGNWWRSPKSMGAVVSDANVRPIDSGDRKYYGGDLIAESMSAHDADLIAETPTLLEEALDALLASEAERAARIPPTVALAMAVVCLLNDRQTDHESTALAHVMTTDTYTAIIVGDVSVWDDEDNQPPCPDCDAGAYYGSHTCPGDTVAGILAHVEGQLREHLEAVGALLRRGG